MNWVQTLIAALVVAVLPAVPNAPLLQEGIVPCGPDGGFAIRVWDIDPTGPNVQVDYRLATLTEPVGEPFLVIIGHPANATAYLRLPGREAQVIPFSQLIARYANACELVEHIRGIPA